MSTPLRDAAVDPRPGDFCAPVLVDGVMISPEVDSPAYLAAVDLLRHGAEGTPIEASDAAVLAGEPWRSPSSSKRVT